MRSQALWAEDTFLDDDLLRQLMAVGEVDLLVGIVSHGNASTTTQAVLAIARSFQQRFTRQRAVIVDACGADKDEASAPSAGFSDVTEQNVQIWPTPMSLRTIHRVTAGLFCSCPLRAWLCARF